MVNRDFNSDIDFDHQLQKMIRNHTGKDMASSSQHPDPETLARYIDETLEEDLVETIKDHLSLCSDCSNGLLQVLAAREEITTQGDPELPKSPEFIASIFGFNRSPNPNSSVISFANQETPRQLMVAYSMAAIFFMAAVTLSFWIIQNKGHSSTSTMVFDLLASPKRDVPSVDQDLLSVPGHVESLTLRLLLLGVPTYPKYDVLLRMRNEKKPVLKRNNESINQDNSILVNFRCDKLESGSYVIELRASGTEDDALAVYSLELVFEAEK